MPPPELGRSLTMTTVIWEFAFGRQRNNLRRRKVRGRRDPEIKLSPSISLHPEGNHANRMRPLRWWHLRRRYVDALHRCDKNRAQRRSAQIEGDGRSRYSRSELDGVVVSALLDLNRIVVHAGNDRRGLTPFNWKHDRHEMPVGGRGDVLDPDRVRPIGPVLVRIVSIPRWKIVILARERIDLGGIGGIVSKQIRASRHICDGH